MENSIKDSTTLMWPSSCKKVTETLGIQLPIIQAPMAGSATPTLVAAAANAGALGSLAAGYLSPEQMHEAIRAIRQLTDRPFAINLFIPPAVNTVNNDAEKMRIMQQRLTPIRKKLGLSDSWQLPAIPNFDEQLAVIIEENIPILSFTFGIPDHAALKKLHKKNVILIGTATTVAEALTLEENGCHFIVAQGSEAGGHRGSFIEPKEQGLVSSFTLIPAIVDAVSVPVIAAGGIMDGRGIIAAFNLGASAVQLGTAFLACHESGISDSYKQAVLHATDNSTTVSKVFTGKYARYIINPFLKELTAYEKEIPDFPLQHQLTSEIRSAASKQNNADYQAIFAGQGVRLAQNISVASLIKQLEKEALTILNNTQVTAVKNFDETEAKISDITAVKTTELAAVKATALTTTVKTSNLTAPENVSAQKNSTLTPQWLKWVIALQSIAQNGLTFTRDPYDKERFIALREISAEIAAHYSDVSYEPILNLFSAETGYATPKLDVRAAVFQNDKVLLVRERSDNLWTLPGGWADVNESPSVGAMRETQEESGYEVKALKLIALFDKHKHDHPPQLPHTYKCFFLCELVGGSSQTSHEISEVKFFALDNLPDLSLHRVTKKQILRCYDHYLHRELQTDFD